MGLGAEAKGGCIKRPREVYGWGGATMRGGIDNGARSSQLAEDMG